MKTAEERFFEKVTEGDNDCWLWMGTRGKAGHGQFWNGSRVMGAHRWSYEFLRAEIPEGLVLDHLCRNPPCVNPWHLEPVPQSENMRRIPRKTHCPQGHPYDASNTIINTSRPRPFRACRTCKNACDRKSSRERYRRERRDFAIAAARGAIQ